MRTEVHRFAKPLVPALAPFSKSTGAVAGLIRASCAFCIVSLMANNIIYLRASTDADR